MKRLILLLLPLGATITTAAQQKKKTKTTTVKKQTHVVHTTHAKTTSHAHSAHSSKTAHVTHVKPGTHKVPAKAVVAATPAVVAANVNPDLPDEPTHAGYVPDSCDLVDIKQEEVKNLLYTLVSELGKPYIRGAIGPIGFDCSGLINYGFNAIGKTLPRTAASIALLGQVVSPENWSPGDLLFFTGRKNVKNKRVGHVGLVYKVEDGKVLMIHSSNQGVNIVDITNSTYYKKRLVAAKRIIPPTDSCAEQLPMNESKQQ